MSALADLTEEEKYLVALLMDQSGIDPAEFAWTDDTAKDFVFRCWDYQYPWYRTNAKFQIDQCGRAIGKSVGIQMRAWAFAFTNPGEEMLITAPEMIHLDPVTKNIEDRIMSTRLSREYLKRQGMSNGITHRPFEAKFRNGSRIVGRIPQKDGKGVKGSIFAGQSGGDGYDGAMLITADRGLIPAAHIQPGDYVLTHTGNFRPVLHVYSYETEGVEVAGAGHRGLTVSTNHRFYGRRNSNPQRTRNLGQPTWVMADDPELAERWYWATPTAFPIKTEMPDFPISSDASLDSFLWMCGHYVADGVLEGTDKRGNRTGISVIDSLDGVQQFAMHAELAGFKALTKSHDKAHCKRISSTVLANWIDTNFRHGSEGKTLPAWLLGAPQHLQERFLEGYLFGDGHWNESKHRWEISTASKPLAIGIKLLAQALGYSTSFSWVDPRQTHIQGVALKSAPRRSYRVQLNRDGHGLIEDGAIWQKIRKVTPVGTINVVDLVVDEDFSYVADGIIHKGSRFLPEDDEVF